MLAVHEQVARLPGRARDECHGGGDNRGEISGQRGGRDTPVVERDRANRMKIEPARMGRRRSVGTDDR
jgi:hypothetical protein